MSSVEKAQETQLYNIQQKTGKTLAELVQIAKNSGLTKHSEIRDLFRNNFGLGYGDANMLAHYARQADEQGGSQAQASTTADALDQIYTGAKADLRPIYDRLMGHIHQFGEFEIATKKGYVSLRRKKQFAMLGPATNTRFEVGINCKTHVDGADRPGFIRAAKHSHLCSAPRSTFVIAAAAKGEETQHCQCDCQGSRWHVAMLLHSARGTKQVVASGLPPTSCRSPRTR